jgi:hypothetical protein
MEYELAGRRRGVDVFFEGDEGDVAAAKVLEAFEELSDGAGSLVKTLDDHGLESAAGGFGQKAPKVGSIISASGGESVKVAAMVQLLRAA